MKTRFILLLLWSIAKSSIAIRLDTDGGYANVFVTLSPNLNYSRDILTRIQAFFEQASRRLFVATFNRTFIKSIEIEVPESWPVAHSQSIVQNADVRIDDANNLFAGHRIPHTQQPRGCGRRGNFIYLTDEYIDEWNETRDDVAVSEFVREWAKLRYGVFEETTANDENGKIENSGCSSHRHLPVECSTMNATLKKCGEFLPNRTSVPVVLSSIMDDPSARVFCNDDSHNSLAPTRHNALCKRKSAWQVISESDDFSHLLEDRTANFSPPTVKLAKKAPMAIVVVIDPELCPPDGLDGANSKKDLLLPVLFQIIASMPKTARVGFVMADSGSQSIGISSDLAHVDVISLTKPNAPNRVTSFSNAIRKAMQMLLAESSRSKHVILLADGLRLDTPDLSATFSVIEKSLQTNVHTLFLLTVTPVQTRQKLIESIKMFVDYPLASFWFNVPALDQRHLINDAFMEYFNRFSLHDLEAKNMKMKTLKSGGKSSFKTPTTNAVVEFKAVGVDVTYPIKLTIDNQVQSKLLADWTSKAVTFLWKSSMPQNRSVSFEWNVTNENKRVHQISLWSVNNPILLSGQLEKPKAASFPYILYAYYTGPYSIEAEITLPDGSSVVRLELRDNGNGDPDIKSGDGIFSRYLIYAPNQAGMHSIRIIATDKTGEAIVQTYLGTLFLRPYEAKVLPPNWIGDFHSTRTDAQTGLVTFQWTAPGDQFDSGRATSYLFECAWSISTATFQLDIIPNWSGEIEIYQWKIPTFDTLYRCGVRARDADANENEMSNAVSFYVPNPLPTTTTTTSFDDRSTDNATLYEIPLASRTSHTGSFHDCPQTSTLVIIGSIVSALVIFAVLNVIAWYLVYKKVNKLCKKCNMNPTLNPPASADDVPDSNGLAASNNPYTPTPKSQAAIDLATVLRGKVNEIPDHSTVEMCRVDEGPIYDQVAEAIYDEIPDHKLKDDELYDDVNV